MKADIRLRPARHGELGALSALILRSKAHWGYDDAFLESCRPELTLGPVDLAESAVVVAERNGCVIGVVQVAGASLEKLFVAPEAIGLGTGRLLLQEALAVARRTGSRELVVEADPGAAGFYERMGARRAGTAPSGSIPGRVLPRLVFSLAGPS